MRPADHNNPASEGVCVLLEAASGMQRQDGNDCDLRGRGGESLKSLDQQPGVAMNINWSIHPSFYFLFLMNNAARRQWGVQGPATHNAIQTRADRRESLGGQEDLGRGILLRGGDRGPTEEWTQWPPPLLSLEQHAHTPRPLPATHRLGPCPNAHTNSNTHTHRGSVGYLFSSLMLKLDLLHSEQGRLCIISLRFRCKQVRFFAR